MTHLTQQQREDFMVIHKAIHDKSGSCIVSDKESPLLIKQAANGCMSTTYMNITFIEQNHNKNSVYAKRAKAGERITWGIKPGGWLLITDNGITG